MKVRYPHVSIALAIAVLLASASVSQVYAVSEETGTTVLESTSTVETTTDITSGSSTMWKAEISDYDSSLSLVEYEEVTPTDEEVAEMEEATTLVDSEDALTIEEATNAVAEGELASSSATGSTDSGYAVSLGSPESGQFAFTTYGYGHCVGMSQNGANYYATYGGYDYQQILFHYYPGTTLVQESTSGTITANGVTGSLVDILSQIVYAEMSSTMDVEAMKAQTVAAYSYIMFYGGSATGLALKANPPQNVIDAVTSVLGQALYYDGSYALTVYGASSGGATASSNDIFGTNYPYLVSVQCDYDAQYDPYYGEVTNMSVDEVRSRIQSAYGITLSSNVSNWIQVEVGDSGYVRSVTIDGQKTVNGKSFSSVLGLRSAKFAYVIG
ncbi:MAG: sporulation protein [Ruminococcus sp.]|nr:sporulation protein [Ruminococcus sp.]